MKDTYAIKIWKSYPFDKAMTVFIKMEDKLYNKSIGKISIGELDYDSYKDKVDMMKRVLINIWGSDKFWIYYYSNTSYEHFLRYIKQLN